MLNYVGSFSGVQSSQDLKEVVFFLDAKAAGTEFAIKTVQASAEDQVFLIQGDGSVDISDAKAGTICEDQLGDLGTARANLKTGLKTYLTNIPAAADGVDAIAFAFGGINHEDVLSVEVEWTTEGTAAANASTVLKRFGAVVIDSVALNGSNALLKNDGTTAIAYGTDQLVAFPKQQVLFGAFTIADVADVPAADVPVKITLLLK